MILIVVTNIDTVRFAPPLMSSAEEPLLPHHEQDGSAQPEAQPEVKRGVRLASLDAVRGLTMMLMIFVNYADNSYYVFQHSWWNGITFADLVFPSFLFIMGVSMVLSFDKRSNSQFDWKLLWRVTERSIKLFLIGLFINAFDWNPEHPGNFMNLASLRIPGVLQRLAVCYFVVSLVVMIVPRVIYRDGYFIQYLVQWVVMLIPLIAYCIVMYGLKAPGCSRGYTGCSGDCVGGMARVVDLAIFSDKHIYHGPTCRNAPADYCGEPCVESFDPEGFMSTLTSLWSTFLGLTAGRILVQPTKNQWHLFIYGPLLLILGGLLAIVVPFNKNLWSPSFVLFVAGGDYIVLGAFYYLIDFSKFWSGYPLNAVGMNPILLYILHETVPTLLTMIHFGSTVDDRKNHNLFEYLQHLYTWMPNHVHQLVYAISGSIFWSLVGVYCYHIKYFLKV